MSDAPGEKLKIIKGSYSGSSASFDDGDALQVSFNPSEFVLKGSNNYAEAAIPGLGAPLIQFVNGAARTLDLELLFDTYSNEESPKPDVRAEHVSRVEKFFAVDGELHAPPPCKLSWGSALEFVGVLVSLQVRYVMFESDGTPVRARVSMSFKEFVPLGDHHAFEPRFSPDRRRVHQVGIGDTIWRIAWQHYGDASEWRRVAEANDLDDPASLEPGSTLVLPPLPAGVGRLQ